MGSGCDCYIFSGIREHTTPSDDCMEALIPFTGLGRRRGRCGKWTGEDTGKEHVSL